MGRPLGAGEMRRMIFTENLVIAHELRQNSKDWSAWAKDNPEWNRMLIQAAKLIAEDDNDN
jgi:hypothetical protein